MNGADGKVVDDAGGVEAVGGGIADAGIGADAAGAGVGTEGAEAEIWPNMSVSIPAGISSRISRRTERVNNGVQLLVRMMLSSLSSVLPINSPGIHLASRRISSTAPRYAITGCPNTVNEPR